MRPQRLRWQLTLSYVTLIFLAMALLGLRIVYAVESRLREATEATLRSQANVVRDAVEDELRYRNHGWSLPELCEHVSTAVNSRVFLSGGRGEVVADSRLVVMGRPGHPGRPEVLPAGQTCAVCHGEQRVGPEITWVSLPVKDPGKRINSLTLAVSLETVHRVVSRIRHLVLWTFALTAVLCAFVGFRIAARVSLPISEMSKMAARIAEGDLDQQVRVGGSLEVAQLASTLNMMASRLKDMVERLHKEMRGRERFVANVSHELRTPATGVRATVDALLSGAKDEPEVRDRFLEDLRRESERLSNLLDNLLQVSRLDEEGPPAELREIRLNRLIHRVCEAVRPAARSRRIRVETELTGDLMVAGDSQQLEQVVANLLDNAIKYTQPGGRITVRTEGAEGMAVVTVSDTGLGIPADEKDRIFDRFYRGGTAKRKTAGGAGLGLAIVKEIVQAHSGEVNVDSTPGLGTTFTVRLPLLSPSAQPGSGPES